MSTRRVRRQQRVPEQLQTLGSRSAAQGVAAPALARDLKRGRGAARSPHQTRRWPADAGGATRRLSSASATRARGPAHTFKNQGAQRGIREHSEGQNRSARKNHCCCRNRVVNGRSPDRRTCAVRTPPASAVDTWRPVLGRCRSRADRTLYAALRTPRNRDTEPGSEAERGLSGLRGA